MSRRAILPILAATLSGCDAAGELALSGFLLIVGVPFGFALMIWPETPNSVYERVLGGLVGLGCLTLLVLAALAFSRS